ncbi:MAG: hypothetical protein AAGA95_06870, partial [Pseudomonadota bacterium]
LLYLVNIKVGKKIDMRDPQLAAYQIGDSDWIKNKLSNDAATDLVSFFERLFRILWSNRKFVT